MGSNRRPFSLDFYRLRSFALHIVQEKEAADVSAALASMEPWRTLGYSPEGLLAYTLREDPALRRYAATVGEEAGGVVYVRYPWLLGPYIEMFAVWPGFQGDGIGRAMMQWIEDETRESSRNVWAAVSSFNTPARAFYQRMGFTEVAPLPDLVNPGRVELLLRKQL